MVEIIDKRNPKKFIQVEKLNITPAKSPIRYLRYNKITKDTVAGVRPHPDWVVCEVKQEPLEKDAMMAELQARHPDNSMPLLHWKPATPIVFEVLAVGSNLDHVKPGEFVSITFEAQDQFAGSDILACHKDDISFVFGEGLLNPDYKP